MKKPPRRRVAVDPPAPAQAAVALVPAALDPPGAPGLSRLTATQSRRARLRRRGPRPGLRPEHREQDLEIGHAHRCRSRAADAAVGCRRNDHEGFAMGMFEMSEEQVARVPRAGCDGYAREKVTDEPVVAAALFRRGGAATQHGRSPTAGWAASPTPRRRCSPRSRPAACPTRPCSSQRRPRSGPSRPASRDEGSRSATRWRSGNAPGCSASTEPQVGADDADPGISLPRARR